ncbi:hypothetical protein [Tritonibacter horizontis]|uniref:Uncharacterized protein n=1 Tax=Tritonibacter horizontis TaxID=1768241 RepID=A0A132BZW3_9RHOB|nr:hypothetical protein [Tritonibacter horizontis]KUP93874.1 hypothetical protein TRIHO_13660 [Tritonibacter horizontis]
MPRSQEIVTVEPDTWTELTSGDALAGAKFQALDGVIAVRRGTDAQPAAAETGWRYGTGQGERVSDLSDISGAAGNRLWGKSLGHTHVEVMVDHA